jgi:hyperosmotically inducible periplasmic protein
MNRFTTHAAWFVLVAAAALTGCASSPTKSADVSQSVRKSLDEAGLKDVTVSQDRDKGIVTLGGNVSTEGDKSRAEFLVRPLAANQVVAVQIAVIPVGDEKDAKAVNKDLDLGIEHNVDAALLSAKMHDSVKYEVKNAVVTLNGEVDSQARRTTAEQIVGAVPNVKQVVNTLQVKGQKATSSK